MGEAKARCPPYLAVREGDHGGRLRAMKAVSTAEAERPLLTG
jgi:hypothetical protein